MTKKRKPAPQANVVEERDLNFGRFRCCGDEDLYPFGCPECGRLMVFCYECDTLYDDLTNLGNQATEINHFDPSQPIFACPGCGYAFEYFFIRDGRYKVPREQWIAKGFAHLLKESSANRGETTAVALSARAKKLVAEITSANVKLGDLKARGKEIKKDHALAMELWSTGEYYPRLLATLIFDSKLLSAEVIDKLASEMLQHDGEERSQLADWLLANQLAKDKKLVALMATWEENPSPILRRLFWYHQARLRWVGQAPPGNSADLVDSLEKEMANAEPEVQWAMNFCAGQIGIHEPKFRPRCIKLGKTLGLYKDEHVSKNCTPSYLPEFIRIEVAKRERNQ